MSIILNQSSLQNPSNKGGYSGLKEQAIMTIDMNPYQCEQIWPEENVIGSPAGTKFICEAARIVQTKNYPQNVHKVFQKYVGFNVILESLGENTGKFNVLHFTDKSL
jgi:hypothetical protein